MKDANTYNAYGSVGLIILYAALIFLSVFTGNFYLQMAAVALPFLLMVFYLSVYYPLYYAGFLVLFIPLSVNLKDIGMGFGISLPAEPMIFILTGLLLLNLMKGRYISRSILLHPVTIAILVNFIWMAVTSFSSSMPMVSVKFMIIRLAFILVFYLFFLQVFGNKKGVQQMLWLYSASLSLIIIFILLRHAQYGFVQQVNRYVTKPFFNDHTIYGAVLAMLLPFFAGNLFLRRKDRIMSRFISFAMTGILLTAIFFSYSRAVWLSIALLIPASLLILAKVRFKYILAGIVLLAAGIIYLRAPLLDRLQNVESERGSDIKEHAGSIANINSSASNKERINRWESALSMFSEKPFLGFGPGTYPFQYAPYQKEENLTRISTYHGDKGGVHSEYLKPLSESGLPGLISFLVVILVTIWTAFRVIYRSSDKSISILAASLMLGLLTYYIHGFVNFFLDTDKTSALFWGMTGMIVALDLQRRKEQKQSYQTNTITEKLPEKK